MSLTTALAIKRKRTVQFARRQMPSTAVGKPPDLYSSGIRSAMCQGCLDQVTTVPHSQVSQLSTHLELLGGIYHITSN